MNRENDSKKTHPKAGKLPEAVRLEIDDLEKKIADYRTGKIGEVKFQKVRLQMGVYAQRQEGVQMQRIKVPNGALTSAKMRCLADVAEKYASGFIHVTTRQDVQIYYVQLDTVPDMMRDLAAAGITTREACGNTVRNVTACHYAGASAAEVFDVGPYADAFTRFMLRNPICQNMGRKFKVAFEGCRDEDHAGMRIHDIGFRARIKDGKRGFQVHVGGGLGSAPMLGYLWTEFMPVEEMIPFSAALIRIFDRYGERKLRMQARMKFLVKKAGFDQLRKWVEAERAGLNVDPAWNDYLKEIKEEAAPPAPTKVPDPPEGVDRDPHYAKWKASCVCPHRVRDYAIVHVRIKVGDITSVRLRTLADIAETFSGGRTRVSANQNFLLRWVPERLLPSLYAALRDADLAYPGADAFEDIIACPGADTCRLGLTSAKGLATRLTKDMANGLGEFKDLAKGLRIKISGCPNSCAWHTAANIGFQGAAMSKDGRTVPGEMLYLGGSILGDDTRLAKPVIKLPTRRAPAAVKRLLTLYRDERKDGEHFDLVMERLGEARLKSELAEFTAIPSFDEDPSFYQDWGHETEQFEIKRGVKGECAGATVGEKLPTFADADARIENAAAYLKHGEWEAASQESYHACSASAHVPLYAKHTDPFTPEQTLWEFENLFVRTGEADPKWMDIAERLKEKRTGKPTKESAADWIELAKSFHAECKRIQDTLSANKK